jgi:MoxR-like ATPase
VGRIRDLGITLSDRRAVKTLKLIAASAVLCGRDVAAVADFWPLRYCWDREEQIGPLRSLVDAILKSEPIESNSHPLSRVADRVHPEEIARALEAAKSEIERGSLSLVAIARLRERLIELADKSSWVASDSEREYLRVRAQTLLQMVSDKKK